MQPSTPGLRYRPTHPLIFPPVVTIGFKLLVPPHDCYRPWRMMLEKRFEFSSLRQKYSTKPNEIKIAPSRTPTRIPARVFTDTELESVDGG